MFDPTEIARCIQEGGLSPLLRKVRNLDKLLCTRCPELRHALVHDGYLLPLHRRMTSLCRRIASDLKESAPAADMLARWLYLHNAELAAATSDNPAMQSETHG